MTDALHEASDAELDMLWPAARAAHLFETAEVFRAWRDQGPWRVRLDERGTAVVLERWREHLPILQIRAAWCDRRRLRDLLVEVRATAAEHGLDRLLSPLLDERAVAVYVRAGLTITERLVVCRAKPAAIRAVELPSGVRLRGATARDLETLVGLEMLCFSAFWAQGRRDIETRLHEDGVVVATEYDEVIGYTHTTFSRGLATLGRIGVRPDARRRGVGAALMSEAAERASSLGARALMLCTQESNHASRALYASVGFAEQPGRLALAADLDASAR